MEDSRRIETQYQILIEADEERRSKKQVAGAKSQRSASDHTNKDTCVPVNEDFLFDVSIERRELCPVYWHGPVYEGECNSPATSADAADMANASSPWDLVFPGRLKLKAMRRKSCFAVGRSEYTTRPAHYSADMAKGYLKMKAWIELGEHHFKTKAKIKLIIYM